jgi:heptosyltransferase-2
MKVLFLRFSSLGDVILITGIIKRFKEQFPDAVCDVFTSSAFAPVFEGLDFINRTISFNKQDGFKGYAKTIQEEVNDYDYIIDLHDNLRTLFLRTMTSSKVLKYKKDSADRRSFVKKRKITPRLGMHVVLKYAETLKSLGMKDYSIEELRPILSGVSEKGEGIVLNPFASKPTKEWDKFPALAEQLVKLGHKVTVVGQGSFPQIAGVTDMTGKTTLRQMFDIIANCETLITTDSGPMHAGIALNKKIIAIFGSTTVDFGFAPEFAGCKIIEVSGLECRPCHVHGQDKCPKEHFKCMKDISVENIINVL